MKVAMLGLQVDSHEEIVVGNSTKNWMKVRAQVTWNINIGLSALKRMLDIDDNI